MNPWVLPILVLTGVGLAQASYGLSSYGIVLDQSCLVLLKNNLTSDCPTYEEVNTVFPDTSNRYIIGEFGYKDGIYQRLPSKFSNSAGYYRYGNDNLIFIDPPAALYSSLNMITIRANLDSYLIRGANPSYNPTDHSMTLGVGRYVESCHDAYLDSSNWLFLLGDTFQYMKNNCNKAFTNYNSTHTTYLDKVTHDIRTSYKYKLEQWTKESIERCGQTVCIYGKDQPSPP